VSTRLRPVVGAGRMQPVTSIAVAIIGIDVVVVPTRLVINGCASSLIRGTHSSAENAVASGRSVLVGVVDLWADRS
jgi:hypothetical protein